MSRVTLVDGWVTNAPQQEIWPRVQHFLVQSKASIEVAGPNEVWARQGSQVSTRLIGGWFAGAEKYPKRIHVRFGPAVDGTQIDVQIDETLGFGILDPMFRNRYQEYFVWWDGLLKTFLPPVVPTTPQVYLNGV